MTIRGLIVSIVMTIVLCIMTLGYAALQQRIDIQGEATVDSTYRVEITSVSEGTSVGDARSTNAPQYNGLTTNFYVGLTNDTDYITYTVEITNYSTVDIILNNVVMTTTNNNMKITKIGISNGDIMLAGSTKTVTIKVKLDTETSSEQISTITITPEFTRLKGGVGSVVEEGYDAYEIGDVVQFADSNWIVIKDSSSTQDYVVLLKQNVLTSAELTGNYAYASGNYMAFYWSATCHFGGRLYGADVYSGTDRSGCVTSYSSSKVKEMLEGTYFPVIGEYNLKEVDGYKIRLITIDELKNNLGWNSASGSKSYVTDAGNDVPEWVYTNFGGNGYWTMTPRDEITDVWYVGLDGSLFYSVVHGNTTVAGGIRPVINLYKAAID